MSPSRSLSTHQFEKLDHHSWKHWSLRQPGCIAQPLLRKLNCCWRLWLKLQYLRGYIIFLNCYPNSKICKDIFYFIFISSVRGQPYIVEDNCFKILFKILNRHKFYDLFYICYACFLRDCNFFSYLLTLMEFKGKRGGKYWKSRTLLHNTLPFLFQQKHYNCLLSCICSCAEQRKESNFIIPA